MQLVGEMELERRDIELPDGTVRNQLSTVHIKKCRYLEQSGCVGMCVNMCKVRSLLGSHLCLPSSHCWIPPAGAQECACDACCIL